MYNCNDIYFGYIAVKINKGNIYYKTKELSSFIKENDNFKLITKSDMSVHTKDIIYGINLSIDNENQYVFGLVPLTSLFKGNRKQISDFGLDVKLTKENIKRKIKKS